SDKLSLVTHHHLLTIVPVKLDFDDWNYGSWEYFLNNFVQAMSVNDEDLVHYAIDGLTKKDNQVCGYMYYQDTFPDLKTVRSLLITEEMRLKSKADTLLMDSSSLMAHMTDSAIPAGVMGSTTALEQATMLPNAFTIGMFHDLATGAWNMDTVLEISIESPPRLQFLKFFLSFSISGINDLVIQKGRKDPREDDFVHLDLLGSERICYSVGDKHKRDETSELNETCVETKVASQGITTANVIMDIVTTQMKDLQGLTLDERLLVMYVIGRSTPLSLMCERLDDEGKIRNFCFIVLHGDLAKTVYMHQPPGFQDLEHLNYVCLLQRSLYGLKQAPRAWFQRFAAYITTVGFTPSRCDSSLFIYKQGDDTMFLLLYVDDIVLTASSDRLLQQIITSLHREFSMTDLGALNYFLGISVTRDSSGMFLSQRKYAMEILERAHMVGCNHSRTPVDTESKLGDGCTPVVDPTLYRSLAAILSNTDSLIAYLDADWAGHPTTRRSTSGYYVFLGNNLLSWSSKCQPTLSRSSAKAEYRGVANAVAETCWIWNLIYELHTPLSSATIVYCDNVSAVYLSSNPVQHQRTKHIEIDIHFVQDLVATGQVRVLHVPSRFQYADIFTKGLPSALFDEVRDSLSVHCTPASTAGEY
nr:ribonuclease H-like domain-containing protein [Tanacetum cinerariifolium]